MSLLRSNSIKKILNPGSGSKKKLPEPEPTEEDEAKARRNSARQVEQERDLEQERLVAEAEIAEQTAKLQREESARIADARAEEERKRRIAEEAERLEAEEALRKSNRASAVSLMEQERERRISEDPQSPSKIAQMNEQRQSARSSVTASVERERSRRLNLDAEMDSQMTLTRKDSIKSAIQAAENERMRRTSKEGRTGSSSQDGVRSELHLALGFGLSAIAMLLLLVLTFEDSAFKQVRETRQRPPPGPVHAPHARAYAARRSAWHRVARAPPPHRTKALAKSYLGRFRRHRCVTCYHGLLSVAILASPAPICARMVSQLDFLKETLGMAPPPPPPPVRSKLFGLF